MLQTRNGKRTGLAAVRVAMQMVEEGLITKEEAIFRVEPNQLYDFLVPRLDEKRKRLKCSRPGCPHLPAPPSAKLFSPPTKPSKKPATARKESGHSGAGRNYSRRHSWHGSGGGHSDFARWHDQPRCRCDPGHGEVLRCGRGRNLCRRKEREMRAKGQTFKAGDWISLDGTTGRVIKGKLERFRRSPTILNCRSSWIGRTRSAP